MTAPWIVTKLSVWVATFTGVNRHTSAALSPYATVFIIRYLHLYLPSMAHIHMSPVAGFIITDCRCSVDFAYIKTSCLCVLRMSSVVMVRVRVSWLDLALDSQWEDTVLSSIQWWPRSAVSLQTDHWIKLQKFLSGCVEELVQFISFWHKKQKSCSIHSGHKCTLSVVCCGCESPWLRRGGSHSMMRFVKCFSNSGWTDPWSQVTALCPNVQLGSTLSPARGGSWVFTIRQFISIMKLCSQREKGRPVGWLTRKVGVRVEV